MGLRGGSDGLDDPSTALEVISMFDITRMYGWQVVWVTALILMLSWEVGWFEGRLAIIANEQQWSGDSESLLESGEFLKVLNGRRGESRGAIGGDLCRGGSRSWGAVLSLASRKTTTPLQH